MSFANRMVAARELEQRAMRRLSDAGWTVSPFGQAMLHEEIRDVLRRHDSQLRYLPDILALRDGLTVLVDCKSELRSDTPNHAIETASYNAAITLSLIEPVAFMFADERVQWSWELPIVRFFGRGFKNDRGSGTPMVLTRKDRQRDFDELFGRDAYVPDLGERLEDIAMSLDFLASHRDAA